MDRNIIISRIMNRRKRLSDSRKEGSMIDSSSMGDMAFLLLIFFIVTSSFILRQGIFFSLPSPKSGSVKLFDNQIVEVFPENSGFTIKGNPISRDELILRLKEQREINKESVVIIKMKDNVKYDRLVDTLSVAKESGIYRVSLKNVRGGK